MQYDDKNKNKNKKDQNRTKPLREHLYLDTSRVFEESHDFHHQEC